jgi:hypothetical protein
MFNPMDKLAELRDDIIRQAKIDFLRMQARFVLTELAGLDPNGGYQEVLGAMEKKGG